MLEADGDGRTTVSQQQQQQHFHQRRIHSVCVRVSTLMTIFTGQQSDNRTATANRLTTHYPGQPWRAGKNTRKKRRCGYYPSCQLLPFTTITSVLSVQLYGAIRVRLIPWSGVAQ